MAGWFLNFAITVAAIPVCANYLEGIRLLSLENALILGCVLGVVYTVLRPVSKVILAVLNFLTLGLLSVAVDTWMIWTASRLIENSIVFKNIWWAAAVALIINVARTMIRAITR